MINKIKGTKSVLPEVPLGYVVCIDDGDSGTLTNGKVYELVRDAYEEDGDLYMDVVVPSRGPLHGFYASRFTKYEDTETHRGVIGLFK